MVTNHTAHINQPGEKTLFHFGFDYLAAKKKNSCARKDIRCREVFLPCTTCTVAGNILDDLRGGPCIIVIVLLSIAPRISVCYIPLNRFILLVLNSVSFAWRFVFYPSPPQLPPPPRSIDPINEPIYECVFVREREFVVQRIIVYPSAKDSPRVFFFILLLTVELAGRIVFFFSTKFCCCTLLARPADELYPCAV